MPNKKNQYQVPKKVQEMDPNEYWYSDEYQNNHRFRMYWDHAGNSLGKQHLIQKCLKCLEIPQ